VSKRPHQSVGRPVARPWSRTASLIATAVVVLAATTGPASASGPSTPPDSRAPTVAAPQVVGPVTGGTHGFPFTSSAVDLRSHGYAEQEFFFSGIATSFASAQPLTSDGRWQVQPAATAPYTSRMLVRAPIDPRRCNGTVVVEWMNVSAQRDIDVDWNYGFNELVDGYAYVGVTAQAVGARALVAWDAARYSTIRITSDDFSYDIFSQAGAAVLSTSPTSPLRGLRVRHVIADGESQSAGRMTTYVNAIAPQAKVFDGFLIHSNGATGAPLSSTQRAPTPTLLRTDLARPVLNFETETDVRNHAPARQPDDSFHRLWEAAGTAHVDSDALKLFGYQEHLQTPLAVDPSCTAPFNTAPESYLMDTAFADLRSWVDSGRQPARAPRMQLNADATDVARDSFGNGLGGIRLPQLEVPTATLTGTGNRPADTNPVSIFCVLFGTTTPFTAATLSTLYPNHGVYVQKFTAATRQLARQGFLLPEDEQTALFLAEQAPVPGPLH
jgi:hypothetical protein